VENILKAAKKLYSGEVNSRYTIEMLAKDSGVNLVILKGLDKGIELFTDMYIAPNKQMSHVEIAEHLKNSYGIEPKVTHRVLLDLSVKGLKAYQLYRERKIHSRRVAGNAVGLDGFTFEYFFWRQGMSDRPSKKKLKCEMKLESLIINIKDLAA